MLLSVVIKYSANYITVGTKVEMKVNFSIIEYSYMTACKLCYFLQHLFISVRAQETEQDKMLRLNNDLSNALGSNAVMTCQMLQIRLQKQFKRV